MEHGRGLAAPLGMGRDKGALGLECLLRCAPDNGEGVPSLDLGDAYGSTWVLAVVEAQCFVELAADCGRGFGV